METDDDDGEPLYIPGWGFPKEMSMDRLPLVADVASHVLFLQKTKPNVSALEIQKFVTATVKMIWSRAQIPTVTFKAVSNMIQRDVLRPLKNFKKNPPHLRSHAKFPNVSKLLEITACRCLRGNSYKQTLEAKCCMCESNLSEEAVFFVMDQRGLRNLVTKLPKLT